MREYEHDNRNTERSAARTGYAEWIALGAVAAGSIGAIVGMTNCSRSRHSRSMAGAPSDPEMITAPHGDKLRGAVI